MQHVHRLIRALGRDLDLQLGVLPHLPGQIGGGADGYQPPVLHHCDPVAQLLGLGEVVGAEEDRPALLSADVRNHLVDPVGRNGVES